MAVYDCYHGTDSKAAESIVRERKFLFKPRNDHWLGNGVYFFIEDMDKAKWWAHIIGRRSQFMPTVLYVPISIDKTELLNLNIEADLKILDAYVGDLLYDLSLQEMSVKPKVGYQWFCFILDRFFDDFPNYKGVRRTFESTNDYIGLSGFKMLSDQLCIKEQNIINFDKIKVNICD